MKPFLATIALLLLCWGASACGSSGTGTSQSAAGAPAANTSTVKKLDRDNDGDNNDDDWHVLAFGHPPDSTDEHAMVALVHDYYTAAVAADGRKACTLLTPFVAESVVESYGHTPTLAGKSCAVVMSKLFKHHHAELVRKVSTLKVMRIGIREASSLVALEVPSIQEARQVTLRRSGGRWTMLTLLDGNIE
jgi:hypothetical protein